MKAGQRAYIALVVVQTAIFGLGNVLMKIAYEDITPLWCNALRFGIALAALVALFGPRTAASLRRAPLRAWLPSTVCMVIAFVLCSVAVDLTTATNAGFFVALPMMFTPILALMLMGRRYTLQMAALQGIAVLGLYLLCSGGTGLGFGLGELVGLACSAFFAAALVLGERGLDQVDPAALSTVQVGGTFLASLASAALFEPLPAFTALPATCWGAIAFLGLVGTCATFLMQNLALSKISSATVSVILCAEPVFTALISAPILGEFLGAVGVVGAACIVASTMLASLVEEGLSLRGIWGSLTARRTLRAARR